MDTKESQKQRSALDSNSYEDQVQATNTTWQNQSIYSQPSQVQPVSHSSPREVQESKPTEGISSNVIEGRKFKLNQRTGGATIFCLVSRMCEAKSETLRENVETKASTFNSESLELGGITKGLRDDNDIIHRMTKLADEVDFSVENLSRIPVEHTIPRSNGDLKTPCKDTIGMVESQQAAGHNIESQTGCSLANQSHLQSTTEKDGVGDVNPAVGPEVGQTSPLRFPLWREPGYTARMDRNSSLRCRALVNNSPTSKGTDMCGHPIDIEVRRFEIKEDEKAESCGGQLVIDTTSVLVRMELIPSPKKEHVNYLFHPPYNPPHVDTGLVESIQTHAEPEPQTDLEEGDPTDLTHEDVLKAEELQPEKVIDLCLPCLPHISPPEKETLTARAERILGIPLLDSNTELTCEETVTVPDLCSQNPENEQKTSPLGNNIADVLCLTEVKQKEMVKQLPDDHADESESECVQDRTISPDVLDTEHNEDPEILWEGKPEISDCPDSTEAIIEDGESQDVEPLGRSVLQGLVFQTDGQEESTEENNLPNENNACSSPPSDPSDLQPESPPDFPCHIQNNSLSCESATETVPPSVFINDTSESPETATHTPQGPCSSTSTDVSPPPCEYVLFPLPSASTPEHPFLNLHCLDSSVHQEDSSVHQEDSSSILEVCEEEHELDDSLQLTNNDITDNTNECLFEDDTEEPGFCDEIADCQKDSIKELLQQARENNKEVTELEEQIAISEDNTTDFESLTEVRGLQQLMITTKPLPESCSQEESDGETEGTGDDACPQSVIHCLDPSLDIKHTVNLKCSPLVSDIKASLDESTFVSDVSGFNSEPALQTDLTSLSVSKNKALHPEPFLSGISEPSASGCLESHTPLLFLSSAPLECSPGFPPHKVEEDTVPLELPTTIKDTEESQYPRSLWDAVNRIRKHTAPDSENEDEEVSELWDPQNAVEHLASIDESKGDMESEDMVFPESEGIGKATGSATDHVSSDTEEELVLDGPTLLEEPEEEPFEDATVGLMQQDEHHEAGLQDDGTLSCSNINRQDLEDTAVNSAELVEEEEEEDIDNNNPDLMKEQETTNNEISLDEKEKDKCYDEVEDSLVENEVGRDETDTNHHASVSSLPLGCDKIADFPEVSIKDLEQPAEENNKEVKELEGQIAVLSVPPATDVVLGLTQ